MKIGMLFVSSVICLAAHAQSATLVSLHEQPYGYTGVMDNDAGAMTGATVLYVKFKRAVIPLTNSQVRVDLSYPDIPAGVLESVKLPQVGSVFKCGITPVAQSEGVRLVQVQPYETAFHNMGPGLDQTDKDLLNYGQSEGENRICSLTLDLPSTIAAESVPMLVTSGLPNLKVRTRDYQTKNFADIATPYVRFMKSGAVSFNTDDEFWFLLSASVYQEPRLLNNFLNSDQAYIETWIKNFAYNVVAEAGGTWEYRKQLYRRFGYAKDFPKTYVMTTISNEVEYEL